MTDETRSQLAAVRQPAVVVDGEAVVAANEAFRRLVDADAPPATVAALREAVPGVAAALDRPAGEAADEVAQDEVGGVPPADDVTTFPLDGGRTMLVVDDAPTQPPDRSSDGDLVSWLPLPALELGADGSVRAANEALTALTGWGELDLVGRPAPFVAEGSAADWRALVTALRRGESVSGRELTLRTVDDRVVPVEAHGTRPPDGARDRLVVLLEDVSERRERETELALLRRVLRHNVRNEVNVVQGAGELLADAVDGDARDHVDVLLSAAERIAETSHQATALGDVLAADRTPERLDLVEVVGPVADRVAAANPGVRVECSLPDSLPCRALSVVDVAVENLLDNAVAHNDAPEPTVHVEGTVRPGRREWAELRIRDNGPPIPEAELEVLRHGDEDQLNHTSGLGLWIAHHVVDGSSGRLTHKPNDPRGNVLTMQLPTPTFT